jgi:hypothetical protein
MTLQKEYCGLISLLRFFSDNLSNLYCLLYIGRHRTGTEYFSENVIEMGSNRNNEILKSELLKMRNILIVKWSIERNINVYDCVYNLFLKRVVLFCPISYS